MNLSLIHYLMDFTFLWASFWLFLVSFRKKSFVWTHLEHCFWNEGFAGISTTSGILLVHKNLAKHLLDPFGILMVNFLVSNLGVVLLQVPFSAISSYAGRQVTYYLYTLIDWFFAYPFKSMSNPSTCIIFIHFSISFIFRWVFGDFGCQLYASVGFIFGLGSIFSFFLMISEFHMLTVHSDFSGTPNNVWCMNVRGCEILILIIPFCQQTIITRKV